MQGVAALDAAYSLEERILLAAIDENTPAAKPKPSLDPARMPCGTIGKVRISRLFLGGNLIGGWAHSRDLTYVSSLFKAYNTEAKIFETLDKPWIAFKTMAAGAIPPRLAFAFAYRQGADFIVAGMFDFQLEQDAKLAIEAVQRANARKRPWHR